MNPGMNPRMNQREELDTLLASIRAAPAMPAGATLLEKRAMVEAMMANYPVAPDLVIHHETLGNSLAIRTLAPACDPALTVLMLHGGGYVMGSAQAYRALSGEISRASGAAVVTPDYRLAPEHPFPAALDDALAAYVALVESQGDASRIALCGDSAGGGLVLATLVAARDRGVPLPVAAALISPWVDLGMSSGTIARNGPAEPILTNEALAEMAAAYLGDGTDAATPLASPVHADLRGLPPLLVEVGSRESLLDDALALASRAAAADVRLQLTVRPHMFHGFHSRGGVLREAAETIAAVGAFLHQRLLQGRSWECQ